jgi:hypothetical protein
MQYSLALALVINITIMIALSTRPFFFSGMSTVFPGFWNPRTPYYLVFGYHDLNCSGNGRQSLLYEPFFPVLNVPVYLDGTSLLVHWSQLFFFFQILHGERIAVPLGQSYVPANVSVTCLLTVSGTGCSSVSLFDGTIPDVRQYSHLPFYRRRAQRYI